MEFPGTPWGEIDKQVRRERLSDLGINEENGLYASPPPAWVALEIMGEGPSHTPKQLAKLPDFLRESYGVFKLDFWQADEEIAEQFLKWLSHRRSTLIEKYDDPVELQPGQIANTAALFCEHKPLPTAVGRGHKKMRCKDLIKDLGRVRFWTYAGGTLDQIDKVCQALGSNPVSRSSRRYFSDLQNIRRAEVRVGETILNLATAWNQPGDVFREIDNPRVIDHPFPGTTYKAPKKAPDKSAIINARKVLEEHFILKSLKTEPIH